MGNKVSASVLASVYGKRASESLEERGGKSARERAGKSARELRKGSEKKRPAERRFLKVVCRILAADQIACIHSSQAQADLVLFRENFLMIALTLSGPA